MELEIYNIQGKKTSKKAKLDDEVFGIEPNDHAIYLDVKQYLANQRQGTHKAKERGEITGSTRKIKKQKGTGTARAGSIKNPLFKGGGRVFGPKPRDYSFKLNKKLKQLARRSALSYQIKNNALSIVEDLKMDAPKTKDFVGILNNLGKTDKKVCIILGDSDKNVVLSSRNLPGVKILSADSLNTYSILNASEVILTEGSIEKIKTILS